jgi:hypothetical protein
MKLDIFFKYLEEESGYNDRYDLWTIESCLESIERWSKLREKKFNDEKIDNLIEEERSRAFTWAACIELHSIKEQRFEGKASTVQKWIETDRRRGEKLENIQEPESSSCPRCSQRMKSILRQFLVISEPLRVIFMFECLSCGKRESIWEDGQLYIPDPDHCPKCDKEIEILYSEQGRIVTWTKNCTSCGFEEIEINDLDKKEAERAEKELRDRDLLNKHRTEFCLSEKQSQEYLEGIRWLEIVTDSLEKMKQKQVDPVYQEVTKLKKIKIVGLEQLLSQELEKKKYIRLIFEKPDVSKHIIIAFNTQDADPLRKEYDSIHKLQRLIKKTLEGTNWRLMSGGMCYKLGYLWGRLKGHDQEDDLVQMIKLDKDRS